MITVRDHLAGTLVPLSVVVHALSRVAAPEGWVLDYLEARGDVTPLPAGGMPALEDATPMVVSWQWIEQLAVLVDDVTSMSATGADGTGAALEFRCVDSGCWEVSGARDTEKAIAMSFVDVTTS